MYDPKRAVADRIMFQRLVDLVGFCWGLLVVKVDKSDVVCLEVRQRVRWQLRRGLPPVPANSPAGPRTAARCRDEVHVIRLGAKVEAFIRAEVAARVVEEVGEYGRAVIRVQDRKVVVFRYADDHR